MTGNTCKLHGVVVATVLPFGRDGAIDWKGYARVLDYCAVPAGIDAVFVNGHAGEGASLSAAERIEVVQRTRRHVGAKPLLAGIIAYSTAEAIAQALEMNVSEMVDRMSRMRKTVRERNIYWWAGSLIGELCELRLKQRRTKISVISRTQAER